MRREGMTKAGLRMARRPMSAMDRERISNTSSLSPMKMLFRFSVEARWGSYRESSEDNTVFRMAGSGSEIPTMSNLLVMSPVTAPLFPFTVTSSPGCTAILAHVVAASFLMTGSSWSRKFKRMSRTNSPSWCVSKSKLPRIRSASGMRSLLEDRTKSGAGPLKVPLFRGFSAERGAFTSTLDSDPVRMSLYDLRARIIEIVFSSRSWMSGRSDGTCVAIAVTARPMDSRRPWKNISGRTSWMERCWLSMGPAASDRRDMHSMTSSTHETLVLLRCRPDFTAFSTVSTRELLSFPPWARCWASWPRHTNATVRSVSLAVASMRYLSRPL
mmetsp:Transcript_13313/g.37861  ORF Transcript_13313/g.37861 Transcript_13313/m.37861 type:complete len:328 (+) Transcript_13313:1000-1983(+)